MCYNGGGRTDFNAEKAEDSRCKRRVFMKKNVFPFWFIGAVIVCTLSWLILIFSYSLIIPLESKPYGWVILAGIALGVVAFFMVKRKRLKLCTIFLMVSAVIYFFINRSLQESMLDLSFSMEGISISEMLLNMEEMSEGYMITSMIFGFVKVFNVVFGLASIAPSIVLSSAILLVKYKKVFTALVIIASVYAFITSGLFVAFLILFMGLSMRKDFRCLLLEKNLFGRIN